VLLHRILTSTIVVGLVIIISYKMTGEKNTTTTTTTHKYTNRLIDETSPYLLQHAHNPVDWYPWGDEAFERAKKEDKPVFLSIGYSTCHWCHVMKKESFENEQIAKIMNEHFVNIKVDREHRPDVDSIYMNAVQMMTGSGGCPELNPDFKFFVENIHKYSSPLMVRTNLTVFFEPGLEWIPRWYQEHKVVIISSLPCYTPQNVDNQRGEGAFEKSVKALKMLNKLSYGSDKDLNLTLVYNPGGDFLPGPQEQLKADYKRELSNKYRIMFNNLFTIINAPIGRFRQYLEANGRLNQYLKMLAENFNIKAAENIMCRNLISVDYRGMLYNCDFNQALGLPIINAAGNTVYIEQLDDILAEGIEIITGEHCYCCTAGAGSSCTGSLVK